MSDITKVFQKLNAQGDGALIGYVTGGDPKPEFTVKIAEALIKGGVDILELGIPFSDPIADGPTIQAASIRSLEAGTTPQMVLGIAGKIKKKHDLPIVILTYFNPVFRMGVKRFFRLAKNFDIDGVVVPDLPVEEAEEYTEAAKSCKVDTVFLATPSTSTARLNKILKFTSGFLYVVSHFGVTGIQESLEDSTVQLIRRFLPHTSRWIPLAVGFGVSKAEHARVIIDAGAEGVIVGSAFVNIVQKYKNSSVKMLKELEALADNLKKAIKGRARKE